MEKISREDYEMVDASVVEIAGNLKGENRDGEQKPVPYRKRSMICYQMSYHSLRTRITYIMRLIM